MPIDKWFYDNFCEPGPKLFRYIYNCHWLNPKAIFLNFWCAQNIVNKELFHFNLLQPIFARIQLLNLFHNSLDLF
jgi:hypothetical protein